MKVGIVGHEAAKFTAVTEQAARGVIRGLLAEPGCVLVSGHCHLGGIDMWAEEEAATLGRAMEIYAPAVLAWEGGFKPRNLEIAASDIVHCVVVAAYPARYRGRRFAICYHCTRRKWFEPHVKSGGCWTAWSCRRRAWHVIEADGRVRVYTPGGGGR